MAISDMADVLPTAVSCTSEPGQRPYLYLLHKSYIKNVIFKLCLLRTVAGIIYNRRGPGESSQRADRFRQFGLNLAGNLSEFRVPLIRPPTATMDIDDRCSNFFKTFLESPRAVKPRSICFNLLALHQYPYLVFDFLRTTKSLSMLIHIAAFLEWKAKESDLRVPVVPPKLDAHIGIVSITIRRNLFVGYLHACDCLTMTHIMASNMSPVLASLSFAWPCIDTSIQAGYCSTSSEVI